MFKNASEYGVKRDSNMVEIPLVKSLANLKKQTQEGGTGIDPAAVWRNLTVLDPNPPGPLASPPYVLALPDDGMDGDLFLAVAMILYRRLSSYAAVGQAFRPIPRSTPAQDIMFVIPDDGMDERAFAEKAVHVRLALEQERKMSDAEQHSVWV